MSYKKKEAPKNPNALKITNQFRANHGMVYEMKGEGNRLIVRVFPRESPIDPDDWRVEARTSDNAEAVVVMQWGTNKADTLREVGRLWGEKEQTHGLPTFDWVTVAQALTAVRAL
jgi:hypothetical protein